MQDTSKLLENLNPPQREAVTHIEGPLLVLAGAGSGKTRVIAHRIAYILATDTAKPWQILAVTFTNKAAREMVERVESLVGPIARGIWISTFHAFGARFMRHEGEKVGIPRDFVILDTDDRRQLIRQILKGKGLTSKDADARVIASIISRWKNQQVDPERAAEEIEIATQKGTYVDPRQVTAASVYEPYEKLRRSRRALDFDDLLLYPLRVLEMRSDIKEEYQQRFHQILVDEYQDTNRPQHDLLDILAARHRNICVVGDDDQSIYGWRGARFENILNFDRDFDGTHIIRLEQNYRSTQNILTAAGGLVRRNRSRKGKELFTEAAAGHPIKVMVGVDAENEAEKVAREIRILEDARAGGPQWQNVAVLYRTTAQSRALEAALTAQKIPYQVVGGTRFYERKEVKDALAYLRLVVSSEDDLAVERVVNVPPRGVGPKALTLIRGFAEKLPGGSGSLFAALEKVEEIPGLPPSTARKIRDFVSLIHALRDRANGAEFPLTEPEDKGPVSETKGLPGFVMRVIDRSGLYQRLKEADDEDALENLDELVAAAAAVSPAVRELLAAENPEEEKTSLHNALRVYLETVSLLTDIDMHKEGAGAVSLMTLHSAKGLEFPTVFITGLEEGLLPHFFSQDRRENLEEERRLCYVGITRAMERCYLCRAMERMIGGRTSTMRASRFLSEIPQEVLEHERSHLGTGAVRIGGPSSLLRDAEREPAPQPKVRKVSNDPGFAVGDTVRHRTFGVGRVVALEPSGNSHRVTVRFDRFGEKTFIQRIARMVKI
jgi:DNA helicase-2/ATP-dependent DNA helicase PcrA